MTFFQIYLQALVLILIIMTILWIISLFLRNSSIVDLFWGMGFVLSSWYYFITSEGLPARKIILLSMVTIWGLRLSLHLFLRNKGKGEDFRYREFRKKYGERNFWWISYFQTFLLQGVLMWMVSAPLLGAQFFGNDRPFNILDFIGIPLWITGFIFETGGDIQLAAFKKNPENKNKVLDKGFWRYTRHPNYFGDSAVWWGFAFFCLAAGSYLPSLGSLLMTLLLLKVSGVALLEKTLMTNKPGYMDYIEKTSAFIPWFPRK